MLVEGPSKTALKKDQGTGPVQLTGRTRTDHIVVFPGHERVIGREVDVTITETSAFTLFGTVVTGEQVGFATIETSARPLRRIQPAHPGNQSNSFAAGLSWGHPP